MSRFDYHGKKIYYDDTGSGRPLLLLHGNTASGRMFAPIVPLLAEKHRVITMDFLGCGQSERIEKWPEDLWVQWSEQAALCDFLELKDVDTEAVISHAKHIGAFFCRPLSCLHRKLLLTGSAADEMFPKGHYEKLFGSICAQTRYASKHIFPHGGHPAMMSNAEDFIPLCEAFFSGG